MIEIRLIREADIPSFHAALDAVSRERLYLGFLQAPPLAGTADFIRGNIEGGVTQFVAVEGERVVGWCDITAASSREIFTHIGHLGMGIDRRVSRSRARAPTAR